MTIAEGKVGPLIAGDQTPNPMRLSRDCAQVMQDGHARFQEAVFRGNVYVTANQSLATLQTGLTTAQTGLGIYNPANSGKNLVLWYASCVWTVAQPTASAVVGLLAATNTLQAAPTSQTIATYRNSLLGVGNAPVAIPLVAGTLAAAGVAICVMGVAHTGALTVDTQLQPIQRWFDGSIIVAPGVYLGFFSSIAPAASSFWGEMCWEEIPV
jgi:hypothetical protein